MQVEEELDDFFNGLYHIPFCSEGGIFSPDYVLLYTYMYMNMYDIHLMILMNAI